MRVMMKKKIDHEGRFQGVREYRERSGFGDLMLGPQAPSTDVNVLGLAIDVDGGGVYISYPTPVGAALGMTDMMTELRCFPANIALQLSLSP
jgi:hypothetical protein